MTTLPSTSHRQAALRSIQHYKEAPGVKELAKGYKLSPKVVLSDEFGGLLLKAIFITLMSTLFLSGIVFGAGALFNFSTLWAAIITLLLGAVCFTVFLRPVLSWVFTAPDSPFVINKRNRANLKKTRRLAAQLGESVVPVLTEEHIAAIQQVRKALVIATGATDPQNYDRIAVLLLEDLNREATLLDIINGRGLTTMDGIEAALRDIESNTTGPVQSGWL